MWKVRKLASFAKPTPIPRTNIEPCPVTNAPPGRHRSQEVSNAIEPHAKRAPIKISLMANAKTAHKVGNQKSWMPRYARDAHSATPLCLILVEVLRVLGAILVYLVVRKVFAKHAQLDSIKIPKVKLSAVKPATRQQKYPTKTVPGVNCRRGARAKPAKNTCMTWDLETNGCAESALQVPCATQIPAGPPCKS